MQGLECWNIKVIIVCGHYTESPKKLPQQSFNLLNMKSFSLAGYVLNFEELCVTGLAEMKTHWGRYSDVTEMIVLETERPDGSS